MTEQSLNPTPPDRSLGRWVRLAGWGLGALLLLAPAVAMALGAGVEWTLSDFIFAGALVLMVGVPLELVSRLSRRPAYGMGVALALIGAFLTIWINGAVGVIGSEDNPANALYLAALAVGVVGAAASLFRSRGMALAMSATATAFILVPFAAYAIFRPAEGAAAILTPLTFSLIMAAIYAGSAALFRRAG